MQPVTLAGLIAYSTVNLLICASAKSQDPGRQLSHRLFYLVHWKSDSPSQEIKTSLVSVVKSRLRGADIPSAVELTDGNTLQVKFAKSGQLSPKRIDQLISKRGKLELRILANPEVHDEIIDAAFDEKNMMNNVVYGASQRTGSDSKPTAIAYWARVSRENEKINGEYPLRMGYWDLNRNAVLRDANTKKRLTFDGDLPDDLEKPDVLSRWLREQEHEDIEILVLLGDGCDLSNEHFSTVRKTLDLRGNPSVAFIMTDEGGKKLGKVTREFLPDGDTSYHLAVLMDGEVMTAPRIMSVITKAGQITGRFTESDTTELVGLLSTQPLPVRISRVSGSDTAK